MAGVLPARTVVGGVFGVSVLLLVVPVVLPEDVLLLSVAEELLLLSEDVELLLLSVVVDVLLFTEVFPLLSILCDGIEVPAERGVASLSERVLVEVEFCRVLTVGSELRVEVVLRTDVPLVRMEFS